MLHVLAILRQARAEERPAAPRNPDQIVHPGTFGPERHEDPPLSSRVVSLAVVELLLPGLGLFAGLELWDGSRWWLFLGLGILLSALVGYAFRSDIQLHPLDLSHK